MREHITHVAFDMHQDSITAAWLLAGASTPEVRTIPHEPKPFRRLVKEIVAQGPARACYEAGPLGYAPQRQLVAWGLPCEVIAPSLTPRRRVYLSPFRKPKVIAGEAGKEWRRQMYRERYTIEGKHAEQKDRHGLRRARYWGLAKVHLQAVVTATVTNLKRLAKLLAPGQRLVPQAA